MTYQEYKKAMENVTATEEMQYGLAFAWLHPERLPVKLVSVGENPPAVIRIPSAIVNRFGVRVSVIGIDRDAFHSSETITDILLPDSISSLPDHVFAGLKNLRNVTIPSGIRKLREGTFEGCTKLENIYYQGTADAWKQLEIVRYRHEIELGACIPGTPVQKTLAERLVPVLGNEAVLQATVHFGCEEEIKGEAEFSLFCGGKDITEYFRN